MRMQGLIDILDPLFALVVGMLLLIPAVLASIFRWIRRGGRRIGGRMRALGRDSEGGQPNL